MEFYELGFNGSNVDVRDDLICKGNTKVVLDFVCCFPTLVPVYLGVSCIRILNTVLNVFKVSKTRGTASEP